MFLVEEQPLGAPKHVEHLSRSFSKAEQAYVTTLKECFASAWDALLLRSYLEELQFTFQTNQDALQWTLSLTDALRELTRALPGLSGLDTEGVSQVFVKYREMGTSSCMPLARNANHRSRIISILTINKGTAEGQNNEIEDIFPQIPR